KVDPISAGAINGAHGVWGDAKFSCGAPAPVDETAPVTTATVAPAEPAASGWYTTAPVVTLAATDESGVELTEYKIGDGPWTAYTEAVTLPEGVNGFTFRSRDTAGNLEEAKAA